MTGLTDILIAQALDPPAEPPALTVAELLAASLVSHNDARALRKQQPRPRAAIWSALNKAYHLRMDAHALDPEHTDPAWLDEQAVTIPEWDTHAVMLAFYEQQLLLNA